MGRLGRVSLLVLDSGGCRASPPGRRDLLEIVEQRHGRKSILIASQIPVEGWPEVIGEPTIADAVLDRIVHNGSVAKSGYLVTCLRDLPRGVEA